MHALIPALVLAALGSALAAHSGPAPSQDLQACTQRCAAIESETDAATCRLTCREAAEEKDRAHIIRWTEERAVGGLVEGQQAPPPPTTTVTHVTPRGSTTQTTAPTQGSTPSAVAPSPLSARERYYFGLVECQERCGPTAVDPNRAGCKLRCLRQRPGPVPPGPRRMRPRTAVGKATPAPAAAATAAPPIRGHVVDCAAQCRGEPTDDDRMTCEQRCSHAQQRRREAPAATTKAARPTANKSPAQCKADCGVQAGTCRSGCDADGADGATCRLQCEQSARSCTRRCG